MYYVMVFRQQGMGVLGNGVQAVGYGCVRMWCSGSRV